MGVVMKFNTIIPRVLSKKKNNKFALLSELLFSLLPAYRTVSSQPLFFVILSYDYVIQSKTRSLQHCA